MALGTVMRIWIKVKRFVYFAILLISATAVLLVVPEVREFLRLDNTKHTKESAESIVKIPFPVVAVQITGSNNDIYIKESHVNYPFEGATIIGSNSERELSIPKGQRIKIVMNGHNNDIVVSKGLLKFINVIDNGFSNSVSEDKD